MIHIVFKINVSGLYLSKGEGTHFMFGKYFFQPTMKIE